MQRTSWCPVDPIPMYVSKNEQKMSKLVTMESGGNALGWGGKQQGRGREGHTMTYKDPFQWAGARKGSSCGGKKRLYRTHYAGGGRRQPEGKRGADPLNETPSTGRA